MTGTPGVYVIERDGRHKIGFTRNAEGRAKKLGGRLAVFIPCDQPTVLEKVLHQRFAPCRLGGEWYDLGYHEIAFLLAVTPEMVTKLVVCGRPKLPRVPVPQEFTASRPAKGKVGFYIDLPPDEAAALRAYAKSRGEKLNAVMERAMRREMANPPEPAPKKPKGK